ncbi:MAG: hypothetical protein ABH846_03825 [Patescibacteria group bacterium]
MIPLFSYYTIIILILMLIWTVIFISRPDLRREMVTLGVLAIFLLPLALTVGSQTQLDIQNNFSQLSLTDMFFAFLLAGIAGVIFHALFGKHYHKLPKPKKTKNKQPDTVAHFWVLRLFLAFLFFVWGVVLLGYIFDLSLPEAVILASIMVAIYIVSHRRDLLADALWSAALTMLIVFITASVASIFAQTNFGITPIYSDASIFSVPLDLIIWSAALGLALGPLYEYIRRMQLK